ncbi:MAG: molybdate ABC transporter substrate-binding protein [Candidatus Poribacteria bacterium]|nr:molybdate ABC transporter substrate-binding protein [Candidatus Poribacteria bacterium]
MKARLLLILSLVCLFLGCSGEKPHETERLAGKAQAQSRQAELLIFGAMSLTDALTEISQRFEAARNVKVYCSFAGSTTLQRQIEKGAPADVFISASPRQVDTLQQGGWIREDTRRSILYNQLVLVVPVNSSMTLNDLRTLTQPSIQRIAIGEPNSVPAGIYGKEALMHLGIWEVVQPKLVPGADVRATLAYVESGEVDVGIVYRTDAAISRKVKIVAQFPNSTHSPIVYPAAVIRDTAHEALARAFVTYLQTSEAAGIFEKYGFSVVP